MKKVPQNTFFLLRKETKVTNETPQFLVGTENGFLPRQEPL